MKVEKDTISRSGAIVYRHGTKHVVFYSIPFNKFIKINLDDEMMFDDNNEKLIKTPSKEQDDSESGDEDEFDIN